MCYVKYHSAIQGCVKSCFSLETRMFEAAYPGINLRMKPHSPTEDLCGKQQPQPPSPVNRAKAGLPPQQSTEHNHHSEQHPSAAPRVAPPRPSASAAPPGPGRGDGGAGRCPREWSRSGETLQRPPRFCRAAPPDGGREARPCREETWHWPGGTRRFLRAAAALAPPRPRPGYLLLQMP